MAFTASEALSTKPRQVSPPGDTTADGSLLPVGNAVALSTLVPAESVGLPRDQLAQRRGRDDVQVTASDHGLDHLCSLYGSLERARVEGVCLRELPRCPEPIAQALHLCPTAL